KPRTEQSYRDMVRLHIAPLIGKQKLHKLTPDLVQVMLRALTAKGLSARTVRYARAILRRALNQAIQWNLISRNVAALTEPPREEKHTVTPLTIAQAQALLEAVRGHRFEV